MATPLISIDYGTGSLVLSDFETATSYRVTNPVGLPAPGMRGPVYDALVAGASASASMQLESAERVLPIVCIGDGTTSGAEVAAATLLNAARKSAARLIWQRSATSRQLATDIYAASLTEDDVNLWQREGGKLVVVLKLTTSSDWYEVAPVAISGSVLHYGTVDVNTVRGDLPARTSVTVLAACTTNALGVGVRSAPAADFDPLDEYTACTYALPATLPASTLAITPPTLGVSGNRGAHEVFARFSACTADSIKVRAVSTTTGAGALSAVTASTKTETATAAVTASSAWHRIGVTYVPSATLPRDTGGSAWAAEAAAATWTTEDYGPGGALHQVPNSSGSCIASQTFTLAAKTRVKGISVKGFRSATSNTQLGIRNTARTTTYGSVQVTLPLSACASVVRGNLDVILEAGTYELYIWQLTGTAPMYLAGDDAAGYAGGAASYYSGGGSYTAGNGTVAPADWYFTVHGQAYIATGSSVGFQAAYGACSSNTLTTYAVVRLPTDDGCTAVGYSFSGNQGVIFDETDGRGLSRQYLTNSAGDIAPLVSTWTVTRGMTRVRPGDNKLVVFGVGTLTVSGSYNPCYSTAAAGDA